MDMFVKQLSVFIENREGRLEQVTEVLKEENINILSLSMADTTEGQSGSEEQGIFSHADRCAGSEAGGQGGRDA